jgi:hypothetical protein
LEREKLLSVIQKGKTVLGPEILNSLFLEEDGALPVG